MYIHEDNATQISPNSFLFELNFTEAKGKANSIQSVPQKKSSTYDSVALQQLYFEASSSFLIATAFSSTESSFEVKEEDIDEFEISTAGLLIQLADCSSLLIALTRSSFEQVDMEVLEMSMARLVDALSSH